MACVALVDTRSEDGQWIKTKCGNDTLPGYKYCEEHKTRKRAVDEREERSLGAVIDASEAFGGEIEVRSEGEVSQKADAKLEKPAQSKNIYEKTNDVLERALDWEEQTWTSVQALRKDEWYKDDKAGVPQLNPLIGANERAQDRTIRAVTAIAKLNIDAQSVNVNKMVRELIKSVVMKAMRNAGLDENTIMVVRQKLVEEFERVASESTQ